MDLDMTPTHTSNTTNTASTKSPEPETETPTRIQPIKPISFTNGVLKRHTTQHHHHHHHHQHQQVVQISYKECLKNHAATLGGHALDGCGEYMPSPNATPSVPASLNCAACGCHRNFHRREPDDSPPLLSAPHVIEYKPHHRHHPPPPQAPPPPTRSPNSASPPPISSSYYPASAPHMLLALSSPADHPHAAPPHLSSGATTPGSSGRKRFRTKFTQTQKERMFEFAERVGWKIQKRDEELIHAFCAEVGVERSVLKVWMHNNKNTFGKKDNNSGDIRNTNSGIGVNNGHNNNNNGSDNGDDDNTNTNSNNDFRPGFDANEDEHHHPRHQDDHGDDHQTHYPNSDSGAAQQQQQQHHVGTNGSSSS